MDSRKKTVFLRTKRNTKKKVLSATLSGTLLMTTILIPTATSILGTHITAKADVLDADLLSNVTSSNNSGTTSTSRWAANSGAHNVDFTISGGSLVSASALTGQRYATLTVPQELQGLVAPNGDTTVTTNITLDLNQVALLNTIVQAGDTFLTSVGSLLDSNPVASLDLTEVTQQLNLLKSVQNIGGGTFSSTTTIDGSGALISAQLDDGLTQVLAQNVTTILTNLKNAINSLQATGLAATVVNAALVPLQATVTTVIDGILNPLVSGTGDIIGQLLNASVLGDTSITIPTKITAPASQTSLDAKFVGTAVKADSLDVNLLSTANGVSYVYINGTSATTSTLVVPKTSLTAKTSAPGAADASVTLPKSLTDSTGANVPVTAVITNSAGNTVTNGSLKAGTYTVTYSASGYGSVTQTLVVTDSSSDTTAPKAPVIKGVTGNSTNGYQVSGTSEPGATINVKNSSGKTIATGTVKSDGTYTVKVPGSVGPNAKLSVTATDASGNTSAASTATTPASSTTNPTNPSVSVKTQVVYRLYNPNTGEHFYPTSKYERDATIKAGWRNEGILENAPKTGKAVYRIYNPNVKGGDHYYTMSKYEAEVRVSEGWKWDNNAKPVFYSGGTKAVYVAYNPNAISGAHNYTMSSFEEQSLLKLGWEYGKTAWYAVK